MTVGMPLGFGDRVASRPGNQTSRQSIAICHGNPILAEGLRLAFSGNPYLSTFTMIVDTADRPKMLLRQSPDILIVNPWKPTGRPETVREELLDIPSNTSVIAYCSDISLTAVQRLVSLRFKGIVPTSARSDELVRIVCSVAFGGIYLPEKYTKTEVLLTELATRPPSAEVLTDRESDVLQRLALGSSMKEVASALNLSTKTVETYKARANRKLSLHSRADIVRYAIEAGWLSA